MERARKRSIVAATLVGVAGGAWLVATPRVRYEFIGRADELGKPQERSIQFGGTTARATAHRYAVSRKPQEVLERLREEAPYYILRQGDHEGMHTWTVTIPRRENGRAVLSWPPDRQVTVVGGQPKGNAEGGFPTLPDGTTRVTVLEYRRPQLLDGVVEWVRRRISI